MQFLAKLLPSSKIKKDIPLHYNQVDNLKPIDISNLSLIAPIKKKILSLRKKNATQIIKRENKKLSLIVPYRHREEHLKIFLPTIEKYLQNQNITYEIIVVEQIDTLPFNKAKLMNIGAVHAEEESEYFIFHDVDLIPENVNYHYVNTTTKLFSAIRKENETHYKTYGETIFGGIILVPKQIFFTINGFSNNYWQWGKEDDDFLMRHLFKGIIPFYDTKGIFYSLPHLPSIMRDTDGNYKKNKQILRQNKALNKANKKYFSAFKRGVINQDNDGITTLKSFSIHSIEKENNIKYIKVSFQ